MSVHAKSNPLKAYIFVWIALLVGTFLTYRVALIDLGPFNPVIALAIATTKALLVALFFMHLRHANERLLKLVVISTIFFLGILLFLTLTDYVSRPWTITSLAWFM
ncbi:MAG TPA: cytochrome C oxidase subunit IV family protein [Dongiaceae bacterium]|nr:cytochrome C oxidase subunit IV family protein [Dongiaceae bacterium]